MLKKFCLLALATVLLTACGDKSGSQDNAKGLMAIDLSTPQGAFMANIQAMKNNDLKALMQASMTPEEYQRVKTKWSEKKGTFSEADKARFAATMQMLTSEGAEDQMMTMIEPQLQQLQAMLPMVLMMANEDMIDQKIKELPMPAEQKENAKTMALAVVDWAKKADLASPEKARKAVTVMVDTARNLGVKTLDEIEKMPFEDALDKGGKVLGGTKQVLKVYGIDLDGMLDSVKIKDVKQNGDKAEMVVVFQFLGQPMEEKMHMIKKNGRWVSAPPKQPALGQTQPQS